MATEDPSPNTFEVRDAEIEQSLNQIGRMIAGALPAERIGFTLFLVEYAKGGATYYISNVLREDMLKALEEFIVLQRKQKSPGEK